MEKPFRISIFSILFYIIAILLFYWYNNYIEYSEKGPYQIINTEYIESTDSEQCDVAIIRYRDFQNPQKDFNLIKNCPTDIQKNTIKLLQGDKKIMLQFMTKRYKIIFPDSDPELINIIILPSKVQYAW